MFKSVNVFQMVVLVLILVGVVMIFMRQNNTCVMENDDVTEGFNTFQELGFSSPIRNKDFSQIIKGGNAKYGKMYTRKRFGENNEKIKAMNECSDNRNCIGLEVDRTGNRKIRQVLSAEHIGENIGKYRRNHLSDTHKKNVILKKKSFINF